MTVYYSFTHEGIRFHSLTAGTRYYVGYSLREAKQRYRADTGLCRKRLEFVQV